MHEYWYEPLQPYENNNIKYELYNNDILHNWYFN